MLGSLVSFSGAACSLLIRVIIYINRCPDSGATSCEAFVYYAAFGAIATWIVGAMIGADLSCRNAGGSMCHAIGLLGTGPLLSAFWLVIVGEIWFTSVRLRERDCAPRIVDEVRAPLR
jgi:hypothetical protein